MKVICKENETCDNAYRCNHGTPHEEMNENGDCMCTSPDMCYYIGHHVHCVPYDDDRFIIQAVRYMALHHVNDSRDIEAEEWEKEFPHDWKDSYEYDNINLPDIPLNTLKTFSGSYMMGGGEYECLAEVRLLMNAFNIKYTMVKDYTY